MSRYRGPRFIKIRRLGALPRLTIKRPKAVYSFIRVSLQKEIKARQSVYRLPLEGRLHSSPAYTCPIKKEKIKQLLSA